MRSAEPDVADDQGVRAAAPAAEIAAAYLPMVRGLLIGAALYYALISVSHPFFETGVRLVILDGLAIVTAITAALLLLALRRRPARMWRLEAAALAVDALVLANVVAYLNIHFEPLKLVYFVLMAPAFGVTAPTRRTAYVTVAAAVAGLLVMARRAPGDLVDQYAFVGVAGVFAAVGMSTLMRAAVMRALQSRLASEASNRELTARLEENQRLQAEAEALIVAAEAANRAKTEFLATISHEIRTPLNGVLGMAKAMEQGALPEDQRSRLSVIQSSAQTLLHVVNDVLDISKIEAGKMDIVPTAFSLERFVTAIQRLYEGPAQEKGLAMTFVVERTARDWRYGDEVRLRQVLGNLVSNAVKFTEAGTIEVTVSGDAKGLTFSVSDTGVGIPPARRGEVFGKFVQVDASTTRRVGGTGLGLSICREILTLMGGEIAFVSTLGVGTCFTFEAPFPRTEALEEAAAPVAVAEEARQPQGAQGIQEELRLLVVDDNPVNRTVLQALLAPLGASIGTACHGREAVAAWEADHWDAILMDVHMPVMDGLAACRLIRTKEAAAGRPRTVIIAVTASVLAHETGAYFEAGMDDFVAKPIEIQKLVEILEKCLATSEAEAQSAEA